MFVDTRGEHAGVVLPRRELKALRNERLGVDRVCHRHPRRHRHGLDASYVPRSFGDLFEELRRLRVGVTQKGRIETHHEQMIDAIPGSVRELLAEAAVHEQRDDEQYDGHGDLSADEHGASPAAPPARPDAVAGFHHGGQIRTRRLNRRHEAEDHRAGHGDDEADRERAAIHLNRERDGKIRRQFDLPEQRHAGVADAEPRDTARQGEQQALRHQLPCEAAAAGADGEAQRHLACARGRPARQETRDVGTCDEQHRERERRQHRKQRRVRWIFRHSRLQFGAHCEPAILVRVGIRALQIRGDRCQFRLRRSLRDSGPQPSLDLEIPGVARLERTGLGIAHQTRRHHQRHEEIGSNVLVHAGEFGRRHADHGQLVAVDAQAAAEHRRV